MKNQIIKENIFIIVFTSANFSIKLYKLLKEKKYKIEMISTPCTISSGCSRSLEVKGSYIRAVIDEINNAKILIQGIYIRTIKNGRYSYEAVNLDDIEKIYLKEDI